MSDQRIKRNTPLRGLACAAVAAVGLTALAGGASAQPYDDEDYGYAPPTASADVIVHARPRSLGRDSATGAPIEWVSASRVVRYDDLDLSRRWGVREFRARVVHAAQDACTELDDNYLVTTPDDKVCVRSAVRRALHEVPYGPDDAE